VSSLCRAESFAWFACHLVTDARRFHEIYNSAVRAYRHDHGIRSTSHPVPDLGVEGDWRELPFWGWHKGECQRGRLFARQGSEGVELRVGQETWLTLSVKEPDSMVHAWQQLGERGMKIRPRALTNTLFARLFVGDLFVHGIGGGKYDELTDEI